VQSDDSRQETQFMPNILDTSVTSKPRLPFCRICWEAVELGTGKTDENGQANHEECNDRQLIAQESNSSPKN
jgi:hypothetical protein